MWIDLIKDTTKYTLIDTKNKTITLMHPHFKSGKENYKSLIRSLEENIYHGYTVEMVGFTSLKGLLILKRLMKHLLKLKVISHYELECNLPNPIYTLKVKLI